MNRSSIAEIGTRMLVLLDAERRAFAQIVAGDPLPDVLNELLRLVEMCSDVEMLASILVLDKASGRLLHGAASSLPKDYCEAIHGVQIGPMVGSCGTAAYRGEPVFVSDIANDPLWVNYRDLALAHGLRACWSTPIAASDGRVLGTFAVYYREPRTPTERDRVSIALITRTAALAIERDESRQLLHSARAEIAQRRRAEERQRQHAEIALKESEARLQEALAAGQVMAFEWNAVADLSRRSQNAAQILGCAYGNEPKSLNDFLAAVHPEDRPGFETLISSLSPDRPSYSIHFRYIRPDGREVWLEEMARAEFDVSGCCVRLKGLTRDITERKKAERLAQRLVSIVESSDDAIISKDLNGTIQSWNRGAERVFGYSAEEIIGKPIFVLIPPDRQAEEWTFLERIRRGEYVSHYETVRRRKDGTLVDISLTLSPLRNAAGVIIGASKIGRDISARKRAEDHQRALNAELDHRVKNVLATVCAIVDQTRESSGTHADFVVGLDNRIRSLASTHDLLSRSHWSGASLAEIATREFAPYATRNSEVVGPNITLKAEATQAVAMVLHELTTNAAKYGALSNSSGRVRLKWRWQANGETSRLVIDWKEVGGPPVERPNRSGYGTCVVRELIPFELGGTVDLAFARDGVRCRLEIPAAWVSAGNRANTDRELNKHAAGP